MKRDREGGSASGVNQLATKRRRYVEPSATMHCGTFSPIAGGAAAGGAGETGEKGMPEAPETAAAAAVDGGSLAAKETEVPRWWQLWVRREGCSGTAMVDYEELLRGWFPFVDEDFSPDAQEVGWLSFSIWEHDSVRAAAPGLLGGDDRRRKQIVGTPDRPTHVTDFCTP